MKTVLLVSALVAYATAAAIVSVDDAMAARVDAQAWQVDRLTKQYQSISDKADAALSSSREAGDVARHLSHLHLREDEEWCPPKTERCGNSPQCISYMRFCDGSFDCKNHYDEDSDRCVVPTTVNSTWVGYPVYDRCTQRRPYEMLIHITSAPGNNVYAVHEKLNVQVDLHSMRGGMKQTASLQGAAVYCKGRHSLLIPPPEDDRLEIEGVFDNVYNDRFIGYIVHEASATTCAEFRFFKQ